MAVGPTGHVTGIDTSQPMLELGRARCTNYPQIDLQECSADSLDAADDVYDVVTCIQLLLYLTNVEAALSEMHRVLKPGGRIAVIETDWRSTVFNTPDPQFTQILFDHWEDSIPSLHLPARLPGLLHKIGFTHLRVEAIPIINTSYLPDNYSVGMVDLALKGQVESGLISQEKADTYLADLQRLSDEKSYFFCVNRFLFTAVV